MDAVRTVGLSKTYAGGDGPVTAVRALDLSIGEGEFFGLLGPNGAGKSTTIGMLTTLVVPTAGAAYVRGVDVARRPVEVKRHIGVVAQHDTVDLDLTVAENLEFRGRYFGMGRAEARRRGGELLDRFGLADRPAAMPVELSGGQARRLAICRALVHRPEVLFLDEPTAGLDPQARVDLWDTLRALQAGGQTILLTTHYLEEAEALCDRVAIIDRGALLACDTVEHLKDSAGGETVITVRYDSPAPACVAALRGRDGVRQVEVAGDRVRLFTRHADGLLGALVSAGPVAEATQLRPSLQTVFLTLTGREYRQ